MRDLLKFDSAAEIIENIFSQLDQERISAKIDRPVEKALIRLEPNISKSTDKSQIHKLLTAFYSQAFKTMHKNIKEPEAELLMLLDTSYRGNSADGYAGALVDCTESQDGFRIVLNRLADIIKGHEKEKYIRTVFATHINPADWQMKCQIVKFIQQKYSSILPAKILSCQPEQLVNEIEILIMLIFNSSSILSQITSFSHKNTRQ